MSEYIEQCHFSMRRGSSNIAIYKETKYTAHYEIRLLDLLSLSLEQETNMSGYFACCLTGPIVLSILH